MLRLSEVGGVLTLHSPAWLGVLLVALGLLLGIYVFRGKARGKTFGVAIVALILIWFGWRSLYGYTRLDDTGVVERGAFGIESVTAWSDIAAVGIDGRKLGRGGVTLCLILSRADGPEVLIQIGALDAPSRVRLLEYVTQRVAAAKP